MMTILVKMVDYLLFLGSIHSSFVKTEIRNGKVIELDQKGI